MTNALPQRGAGDHRRRPRPQSRDPWLPHRRLAAVLHRRHSSNTSILASGINRDDGSHISSDAARARRFTRGRQVARVRSDDLRDHLGEACRAPPRCCQREGARTSSHHRVRGIPADEITRRSRRQRSTDDDIARQIPVGDLNLGITSAYILVCAVLSSIKELHPRSHRAIGGAELAPRTLRGHR